MNVIQDPQDASPAPVEPSPPAPATGPGRSSSSFRWPVAGLVVIALLVGGVGGGAVGARLATREPSTATVLATSLPGGTVSAQPGTVAAIYRQDAPGVVTVSTEIGRAHASSFAEGTGSGIVVDTAGDILTNAHVVRNGHSILVTFSDGRTVPGTVKGVDDSDDLAVIHVSAPSQELHPLTLGNSDDVQVGDTALAIGSPFELRGTLTAGIVSGLNRSTTAPSGRALTGMIQTDAPINPGNSGGALLDGRGAVIGINDSIQSPVEGNVGIGFAIPINKARRLLPQLEQGVAIQHPWLGISGQDITQGAADSLGLAQRSGILVVDVVQGSPAQQAGLRGTGSPSAQDDVITGIDGQPVTTVEALTAYLDTRAVGDRVSLAVVRGSEHLTIQVTLGNFQPQQ